MCVRMQMFAVRSPVVAVWRRATETDNGNRH